jgi:hypothetical protein
MGLQGEACFMKAGSMRRKTLAAGVRAAVIASFLPAAAAAQSNQKTSQELRLERKSELLEERLSEERMKLQEMESELQELRGQLHVPHGRPGAGPSSAGAAAQKGGAALVTRSGKWQPSQPQSAAGATSMVQASQGARKKPGRSVAVQAAYQQQNALFRPGLTLYPQFQYSYTNSRSLVLNGFLAFGAIFLGNVNVTRVETNIFNLNPQVYYAFNRHFELTLNLPYFYDTSTFKEIGVNNTTAQESRVTVSKYGLGDATGGFYWQVLDQHKYWPNLIWNLQVSAPTGESPYGIKMLSDPTNSNLKYPSNLPTGKGVWGVSSGFSIIRELDPVVLFGSGNYYYEFTQNVGDLSTSPGQVTPGQVAPGNSLSYTLGASVSLNERFSTLVELQDVIANSTEIKPKGGGWSTIPDSSGNAAQFIFGATYAASHNLFPFIQAGIGATQYAPNFQISLWVPYYFSF